MSDKHLFIFSHDNQIAWYAVFADAFRSHAPGNKVVLLVHGPADVERGKQAGCYDIVVDLIEGFTFDPGAGGPPSPLHNDIVRLEADSPSSFFWDDVRTDRWLRARNDPRFTVAYLNHAFTALHNAFGRLNPVAALGEYTMAIYRLAFRYFARQGKRMFYPITTRYFARLYFETDLNWEWAQCIELYKRFVKEGVPSELAAEVGPRYDAIATKAGRPNYTQYQSTFPTGYTQLSKLSASKLASKAARAVQSRVTDEEYDRNVQLALLERGLVQKLRRMTRERLNHAMYNRLTAPGVPPGVSYGVYFFHFQPEYTSDALGRMYAEQQFLIRNIAAAMPAGMSLVVKEHPTMVGLRDHRIYEQVAANANVVLVHHTVDSAELIRQSEIVFTIVGTPAIEAMWIGKPAIMFGRYAFAETNTISLCRGFWELGDMIRAKLSQRPSVDEVKKHGMALLAAKYQASRPGQIPIATELIPDFLADVANVALVKHSFIDELKAHRVLA